MTSIAPSSIMEILVCTGMINHISRVVEGEVRHMSDILIPILSLTAAFDVLEAKGIALRSESNDGMDFKSSRTSDGKLDTSLID